MTARYLVSIDQSKSKEEMEENAALAIHFSSSPYMVGVDLSGNVAQGKDNVSITLDILNKCKNAGLKIAAHIAETAEIDKVQSAQLLALSPDRLGHATFIDCESSEGRRVQSQNMMIECCLTSNILCKTVPSYREHHLVRWAALGHPVIICTDDAGVFNTSLSQEYQLAIQHCGFTLDGLRKMNLRAADFIFDESMKKPLIDLLQS